MVLFALVRIRLREVGEGFIEEVALSEITADHQRLARSCMSMCQRPAADFRILDEQTRGEQIDLRRDLYIPKLPHIKMAAQLAFGPAQKNVTGRLHEPAAVHDALAVVGINALARIRLEH